VLYTGLHGQEHSLKVLQTYHHQPGEEEKMILRKGDSFTKEKKFFKLQKQKLKKKKTQPARLSSIL